MAANKYIPCASFEYIATSQLPGFKKSSMGSNVYFKDWSPVTINLSEYSGKQIKLEFTTADCTQSGHFGYAYVDVGNECLGAITGNFYCGTAPSSLTLKGPSGFEKYNWYNENLSTLLGTGQSFTISPAPPGDTKIALQIIPYPGFGCLGIIYSTIQFQPEFAVNTPASVCAPETVDITASGVVTGDPGLTFTYWKDALLSIPLTNPKAVSTSGTYYIKGTNRTCFNVKPIVITINPLVNFVAVAPPAVCWGTTVDLTASSVTSGSASGLSYTYWKDSNTTIKLDNPDKVTSSGQYYIKAVNSYGCTIIKPVVVTINALPEFAVNTPASVCAPETVDITASGVVTGDPGLTFTYWKDALLSIPLTNPKAVSTSGTYYIKAENQAHCVLAKPVEVVVNQPTSFFVTTPTPVYFPSTVDITNLTKDNSNLTFSYSYTASGSNPVENPKKIEMTGTYYIIGVNQLGCKLAMPVFVKISPTPKVFVPTAFTPLLQSNMRLFPFLIAVKTLLNFKIYNKWGTLVYQTSNPNEGWDGYYQSEMHFFDTYTWYLEGIDELGNNFKKTGNSILVR